MFKKLTHAQLGKKIIAKIESGKVSDQELISLQTKTASKKTLNLNFPLLVEEGTAHERVRYYSPKNTLVKYKNKTYLFCSQWFDYNDDYVVSWLAAH